MSVYDNWKTTSPDDDFQGDDEEHQPYTREEWEADQADEREDHERNHGWEP